MGFAGIGMVVDLGTLQHTVYPYCGILGRYSMGILQHGEHIFYCFKCHFFSYLIIVCYCVTL